MVWAHLPNRSSLFAIKLRGNTKMESSTQGIKATLEKVDCNCSRLNMNPLHQWTTYFGQDITANAHDSIAPQQHIGCSQVHTVAI